MKQFFSVRETIAPIFSLFLSTGTLVCCAIPAMFATLGMGATLAGLVTQFPQLIWLSKMKYEVFGGAAVMLIAAGIMLYRARNLPCPADAKLAKACKRLRLASVAIYIFSVLLFLTGAFFAFVAPYVLLEAHP
jgi:hypothetical protein